MTAYVINAIMNNMRPSPSLVRHRTATPASLVQIQLDAPYPQCSVTEAREIVALLEKVRLLPCGPFALLAQSGLEQWVSTPRVGSSNLSKGANYIPEWWNRKTQQT